MTDQKFPDYEYDEDLLAGIKQDGIPRVRVFPFPKKAVILGRGSNPEEELYLENCEADSIPIYRRRGGGCAVVLDPGNLIVSVVLASEGFGRIKEHFNAITWWLIEGLRTAGVEGADHAGISDIVIGDKKIGGSSLYRPKGYFYYSCSLLISPELGLLDRYLKHPPREPDYRQKRPHHDFVGTIKDLSGIEETKKFADILEKPLDLGELVKTLS